MPLTDEERKAIVVYRLEKAGDAFVEAKTVCLWSIGIWRPTGCITLPITRLRLCSSVPVMRHKVS